MKKYLLFLLTLFTFLVEAKIYDYGIKGHTFTIKERSMLELIQARLLAAKEAGKLDAMQDKFVQKVKKKVLRPAPVQGIIHTEKEKIWTYDPSITQKTDIKDTKGQIIVAAGTTLNPLDKLSWGPPLILIDGDDVKQLNWAIKQKGKIVLVKGSPIRIYKDTGHWCYFDQAGIITEKFGISQVPAVMGQQGKVLIIKEVKL